MYPPLPFSGSVCAVVFVKLSWAVCVCCQKGAQFLSSTDYCRLSLVCDCCSISIINVLRSRRVSPFLFEPSLSSGTEDPSIRGIPRVWDQNLFIRLYRFTWSLYKGETDCVFKRDVIFRLACDSRCISATATTVCGCTGTLRFC